MRPVAHSLRSKGWGRQAGQPLKFRLAHPFPADAGKARGFLLAFFSAPSRPDSRAPNDATPAIRIADSEQSIRKQIHEHSNTNP
jgi:hypothetical protein